MDPSLVGVTGIGTQLIQLIRGRLHTLLTLGKRAEDIVTPALRLRNSQQQAR
jgi:hypothetical protein